MSKHNRFSSIFGRTVRGKVIRLAALGFILFLDVENPGYFRFKNPIEPFVGSIPLQNVLQCPSNEVATLPPIIPLSKSLESKSATEQEISRKLGSPVCRKDGSLYWKLEALGKKYYLAAKVDDNGKIKGYKFYEE